jgi:hypothetical protein
MGVFQVCFCGESYVMILLYFTGNCFMLLGLFFNPEDGGDIFLSMQGARDSIVG